MAEYLDLTSLKKPELLIYAQQLQDTLKEKNNDDKATRKLKRSIRDLENQNDELYDRLYELEKNMNGISQYTRRENIEISGIPANIIQKDLEKTVIDLLKSIGVEVSSYNIAACHRLRKLKNQKTASVIVRFINRQHALLALKNRKYLADSPFKETFGNNMFINENLCPKHREIHSYALSLKRENLISKVWT